MGTIKGFLTRLGGVTAIACFLVTGAMPRAQGQMTSHSSSKAGFSVEVVDLQISRMESDCIREHHAVSYDMGRFFGDTRILIPDTRENTSIQYSICKGGFSITHWKENVCDLYCPWGPEFECIPRPTGEGSGAERGWMGFDFRVTQKGVTLFEEREGVECLNQIVAIRKVGQDHGAASGTFVLSDGRTVNLDLRAGLSVSESVRNTPGVQVYSLKTLFDGVVNRVREITRTEDYDYGAALVINSEGHGLRYFDQSIGGSISIDGRELITPDSTVTGGFADADAGGVGLWNELPPEASKEEPENY